MHCTNEVRKIWSWKFGSKIWMSCFNSESRGVGILFSSRVKAQVCNVIEDNYGRYILFYATIEQKKWLLVCVYAPNDDDPDFFKRLGTEIDRFSPNHCVVAGDFNLALDYRMDRMGSTSNNQKLPIG